MRFFILGKKDFFNIYVMKKCINCEIEKDIVEFYKNKANKDGYSGKCKICTRESVKLYRENNLEEVQKYKKGLILIYEAFYLNQILSKSKKDFS